MGKLKPRIIFAADGRHITVTDPVMGVSHTFELVDRVTLGYEIWNIGKNMADGYLPLCRLKAVQEFEGGRSIEPDTLRAVPCEGAQVILQAVHSGCGTVKSMERYLEKHRAAEAGTWEFHMVQKIKKALPYMRQIKGLEG